MSKLSVDVERFEPAAQKSVVRFRQHPNFQISGATKEARNRSATTAKPSGFKTRRAAGSGRGYPQFNSW